MQLRQRDFATRLLIVALLVCSVAYAVRSCLMAMVLPGLREVVKLTHPQFTVFGLDVSREPSPEALRLRTNLVRPVQVAGHTIYPIAWPHPEQGGFEVKITLGGVLSPAVALLIAAAIWPWSNAVEGVVRMSTAMALAWLITFAIAFVTLHAELLHVAFEASVADEISASPSVAMMASRLLMDGGGFAIAIGLAWSAVAFGSLLAARDVMRVRRIHARGENRVVASLENSPGGAAVVGPVLPARPRDDGREGAR